MKLFLSGFLLLSLVGCSSTKSERETEERDNDDIEREYIVRDASSSVRPGWIEDASIWAKNHGKNLEKNRYFSYETEPKVSRSISCNIAKANARADIAGEITTFISKELSLTQEGNASVDENNPDFKAMQEYVDNSLSEKVQSMVHGAAIEKTYWEKRAYKKSQGAKRDFKAYTCAVFVRMDSKRLANAVRRAFEFVVKKAETSEMRRKVRSALQNSSKKFLESKRGEI